MGYVVFQSRRDHHALWQDNLFDEPNDEETLVMLHQGDAVVLTLKVTTAQYAALADRLRDGVRACPLVTPSTGPDPSYQIEIEFVIAKRVHAVLPDWMNAHRGYRHSHTTIYLQPVSEAAEDILLWLRSQPTPQWQPDPV